LAEEKGFLCRDESLEGIRYYENLFLKLWWVLLLNELTD
jgi:hypothetical protein